MTQRKRRRAYPLRNAFDCKRYVAKLINRCERGEVKVQEATRLAYLIGVLLKCIEISDIAGRLAVLERNAGLLEGQRRELIG
jgi:hypothetical protein